MKRNALCIILAALLSACATTHPGKMADTVGEGPKFPLKVSAQSVGDPAGDSFQLFEVTLENTSEAWLKINQARVVTPDDPSSKISVVVGRDLKDWAQAMNERQKKEKHNEDLVKGTLLAAGAIATVAGGHNNNDALMIAGAAAMVGSSIWIATDVMKDDYRWATSPAKVPDTHLNNGGSIPGKMYLRRWVLLNKPANAKITSLVLEFETVDGAKSTYAVSL